MGRRKLPSDPRQLDQYIESRCLMAVAVLLYCLFISFRRCVSIQRGEHWEWSNLFRRRRILRDQLSHVMIDL